MSDAGSPAADVDAPVGPSISGRGTLAVSISTVLSAGSGLLILFLAARSLGPAAYADFSVFWGFYFAVLGVLFGLQQEATRSTSTVALGSGEPTAGGVRVVRATVEIGALLGVLVAATAVLWSGALFASDPALLAAVVALGCVLYGGQTGLLGALAGRRRWFGVAAVVSAEAVGRLLAIALAAALGWGLGGYAVATASAALLWVVVCVLSPSVRSALRERGDVAVGAFRQRSAHAMGAAAASAVLLAGFPVLLELTTAEPLGAVGGALVLAVTLTRAPLLVPLTLFQGVAINHFVAHRSRGLRALARPALGLVAVGGAGAFAAWLVGRPLLELLFDEAYSVDPGVLAALTVSAALVAGLTLTGSAVIADGRHRAFMTGWVVATATTTAVLLAPGSLTARAVASLLVGPVVGMAVHLVTLARRRP